MEIGKLKEIDKLEQEGVWREYEDSDLQVKIARYLNARFQSALRKARIADEDTKAFNGETQQADLVDTDLHKDLTAEYVLLDWKGLTVDGKEVPYSVENSKELMRIESFYREVRSLSLDYEQYKSKKEEDQAKNL